MSAILSQAELLQHALAIADSFHVAIYAIHPHDPVRGVVRITLLPELDWRDVVAPHWVNVHREPTGGLRLSVTVGCISVEVMNVPPDEAKGLDLYEHGKPVRLVTTQSWALVPREAP